MAKNRPFNRANLAGFAPPDVRPPMAVGALVWRYMVLLPVDEQSLGAETSQSVAEIEDINNLRAMLSEDFGGTTILAAVMGYGLRDPKDPTSLEVNRNLPFLVYATPISASDRYFDRLERELREAFNQGVILIERQEAFLFASGPVRGA
jgi:hypothetical protein